MTKAFDEKCFNGLEYIELQFWFKNESIARWYPLRVVTYISRTPILNKGQISGSGYWPLSIGLHVKEENVLLTVDDLLKNRQMSGVGDFINELNY